MKTFVVNLKRRPDRRERMERLLPASWAAEYTTCWPGPLDGQRIDPRSLPGYRLFPWQISSENPWWNRPLKRGEIGCAVSHLECWRRAAAANADMVMVLEDDVVLADRCEDRLAQGLRALNRVDANWDLVYLGRRALGGDEPVAGGIIRPGFSYCTFGYMLSAEGLAKVLAARLEDALIPVDEFLPALYLDHPRADVRRRYPRRLHAYAFEPSLVADLPYEEAGSDTEASEFAQPGLDGTPFREVVSPLTQPAARAALGASTSMLSSPPQSPPMTGPPSGGRP